MSTEDLWSTIWGKVVTKIRDEILYNGEETEEEKIEIVGPSVLIKMLYRK